MTQTETIQLLNYLLMGKARSCFACLSMKAGGCLVLEAFIFRDRFMLPNRAKVGQWEKILDLIIHFGMILMDKKIFRHIWNVGSTLSI